MTPDVDILKIDEQIKKQLSERNSVDKHLQIIKQIDIELTDASCSNDYKSILKSEKDKINRLLSTHDNEMNFYICETIDIIEKYKDILKTPKKVSFMGKIIDDHNEEKTKLINDFNEITSTYSFNKQINMDNTLCTNCLAKITRENREDDKHVCEICFVEQNLNILKSSFNDTNRVNISSKYSYDRKSHFRDCINQYQGKQGAVIPDELYKALEIKFKFHNLLCVDENTPRIKRYSKITKKTILTFLKEIGYPKHYENINLIYSNVTGVKLNDISHIITSILNDFDILVEQYDKTYATISRKNFINTQYVLFQLLRKHNHLCQKEDFTNIKTIDRKFFHDNIMKTLFEQLGWNYTSIF